MQTSPGSPIRAPSTGAGNGLVTRSRPIARTPGSVQRRTHNDDAHPVTACAATALFPGLQGDDRGVQCEALNIQGSSVRWDRQCRR